VSEPTETEIEALRLRVAELEAERSELVRRTNAAVAAAQRRSYWLDRWHIDLDAIMRRPLADRLRRLARAARMPVRALRKVKRALVD
jgi:hypothetical protein